MLLDGETFYGTNTQVQHPNWHGAVNHGHLAAIPMQTHPHLDPVTHCVPEAMSDVEAHVFVNHGRWMVRCPFCPSAQYPFRGDKRFFCAGLDGCANAAVGGKWVKVIWPSAARVKGIEALLEARPDPYTRNWEGWESDAQLAAENEQNGIA